MMPAPGWCWPNHGRMLVSPGKAGHLPPCPPQCSEGPSSAGELAGSMALGGSSICRAGGPFPGGSLQGGGVLWGRGAAAPAAELSLLRSGCGDTQCMCTWLQASP